MKGIQFPRWWKGSFIAVLALALLLTVATGRAQALLITIGTAEYLGGSYNLIYDADSPFGSIVWLDFTRERYSRDEQYSWAWNLNDPGAIIYHLNSGVSITWDDDWRLPSMLDDDPYVFGYLPSNDGTTPLGFNNIKSELGHLYYSELGNLACYDSGGNYQPGWGLDNIGPFINLIAGEYWTGQTSHEDGYWFFSTYNGEQNYQGPYPPLFAMAVRPGHLESAPVPEPSALLLLGAGLIGVGLLKRRVRGSRQRP